MKFKFAYTRLLVDNYEACLQFYRDILGLTVSFQSDINQYTELETSDIKLTLIQRQKVKDYFGIQTPLSFGQNDSIALTFEVKDLDQACQALKQQDVQFLCEPWQLPEWGVISTLLRDPDGNLVELIQPISPVFPAEM